jgi:hypothetical protein
MVILRTIPPFISGGQLSFGVTRRTHIRMARKPKDPIRSAAQLRVIMRRWQQRAWLGVGLTAVSVLGLLACWSLRAHGFWWFLSIATLASALIEVFADINAYHDTKKRVADMEKPAA